ncbi:type IX secretion system periplasmic lipoprotein PorW/SprE [Dokdonia pacifica]|uniref:type IX secretion system periplasmic lipoprotein PorW/SprE n=1 Tax=Dokdonia pacifica TaxID=1627892 RepID=UPI003FCDF2A6
MSLKLLIKYTCCFFFAVLFLTSCSRKKNSFLSRNYHAVTTEYNTLYNGEVALDEGRESLISTFNDNYWDILPIERIAFKDEISIRLDEEDGDPNFLKAEEKAIKAIQKHSMKIDGEEYNPQVDEAFMILGKARYYDQRFVPALEAFNYVLAYYPKSNNIAQAKIWKQKANIRLDNNEVAIENLLKIFRIEDKLKDQDKADAYAILAQAYLNLKHQDTALIYMKEATKLTKRNEERGRYNYIKGQLYNNLGHKDSANLAFQEVIDLNRKIPRKYLINAHIEQARNFDYENDDQLVLLELLEKLENNRENRPFLDKIYYAKAEYYKKTNQIDSALANYNKSLREDSQDKYLNSRDYLAIAEHNFETAQYQTAGSYYDSVLGSLDDKTREFRIIRKKRENLTDVIKYEELSQRNDSILRLTSLSEDEQRTFFEEYIAKIKEKERQDSISRVEDIRNNEFFKSNNSAKNTNAARSGAFTNSSSGNAVGEFYFYNTTAVAYGRQAFRKRWGKRGSSDGWRISTRQDIPLNPSALPFRGDNGEEDTALTVDDYMSLIPTEEKALDSLKKERDFAYFQLGLIYKEKFKEYPLASNRLEKLLEFNPEEQLILPAKYNLYQIYGQMEDAAKQNSYKQDITSNYPDSRYASIINNPDIALEQDASSPEAIYNGLFREFQNQRFGPLLTSLDERIEQFYGDPYLPKFELLKAMALGRYKGYKAYNEALKYVALTYPRADEGKKAQELLNRAIPKMKFRSFQDEATATNWKIVYAFNNSDVEAANTLKKQLDEAFETIGYTNYATSFDVYNDKQSFIVVHYLNSKSQAEGLVELLAVNKDIKEKITKENTIIASGNYKIIQLHKNLEDYIQQSTK